MNPAKVNPAKVKVAAGAKPLERWTMDELLERCPQAADVLARHGVDPRTRCHRGARAMTLANLLGKVCPVDDRDATLHDLSRLLDLEGSTR